MRVLITGANRGLGLGIAKALVNHGHRVVAINRTIGENPGIDEVQCDLRHHNSLRQSIQLAAKKLGGFDICIANAAVRKLENIETLDVEDWLESLDVNLTSCFILMQECMRYLRESKGLFVVIGSQARSYPFETGAAYCATKATVKALCEVALMENRPKGVRITHLSIGAVRNRPLTNDNWKIDPIDIGEVIAAAAEAPSSSFVSEVEIRPREVPTPPLLGKDRIQSI